MRAMCLACASIALTVGGLGNANAVTSVCFGTIAKGRLENAVQLPTEGKNFTPYSSLGVTLGRTYVHSKVSEVVLEAYRRMEVSAQSKVFVYGETGWAAGGRIRPHRTHQNGLSVDFMVPIVDDSGRSVPLPTTPSNKFGYNIEFDVNGKYDVYAIDFEAIAEHLYQLNIAGHARGVVITRVIFDPPYLPKLLATKHGKYLKANVSFMKGKAWVRHDEHYHVDFAVPCRPL